MKALAIHSFQGPDALEEVQIPHPEPRGNEVLVEVATVAVNRLDLAVLWGRVPGTAPSLPLVPGIDPSGVVAAMGAEVEGVDLGDRVVAKPNIACFECPSCMAGEPWACTRQTIIGVHRPGGLAPVVAIPARNLVPLPDTLTFAEATAAIHSLPVALRMIRQAGGVAAGSRVLVLGGAGAVGSSAVQLCRHFGASVTGVVSGKDKAAYLEGLGAAAVDRTAPDPEAALEAAAGDGFDLVLDTAGDPNLTGPALRLLAWRGTYATCAAHAGGRIEVDLKDLYQRRQTMVGSSASGYDDVAQAFALLAHRRLQAPLDQVRPATEAREAYADLADRKNIGKIVLEHHREERSCG